MLQWRHIGSGVLIPGIGSGDYEQEFRAYGYAYPEVPERLRQLREAVQVVLAMWTDEDAQARSLLLFPSCGETYSRVF